MKYLCFWPLRRHAPLAQKLTKKGMLLAGDTAMSLSSWPFVYLMPFGRNKKDSKGGEVVVLAGGNMGILLHNEKKKGMNGTQMIPQVLMLPCLMLQLHADQFTKGGGSLVMKS